ncbi:MAG: sensor histidine kinase, partial [Lachnobacterium sp.]|nr:sensor histidine kinase [Lachnobacterium sp.]
FIGYRNVYVWFFGNIVIFSILIKLLVDILYIREGIHKISSGETSYKLNSRNMMPIFKAGVDDINNIADGIEMAVNEKTKSERMKTELITNVSHDIKTPLTSIINYADLIKKQLEIVDEENKNTNNRNIDSGIRNKTICNESEIQDYCEVLGRQSIKLKRLIEDLVEASKASTGNLEIKLAPCEASVFMTQIVGEYREKFEEVKLDLVAEDLENNIKIMADGRRMLRVFDNIMNNICKYSLAGTRVYLQLEENNGNAVFIFKNISREPLNLSPEELMERFVRGDKSRSTEGNGLGLSIAKSMTELQGGTMKLEIDGDLFKVNLIFPLIREEQFLQKELLEE